ncbi:hypothetical protein SAMN05421743_1105 [Thalassobacillus cyri]|uniref:Uncharacterized protein n=1 Tax=Thalassobacillus cyri TaxID=571932 RepID=A0A1H4EWX7_9BACI|nr:hypothetical protein [Thalassobacillus cyri]SEA89466.1 hypothetical protein SAMN05421743_1105 [Thalassobacillus cyri]
MVIAYILPLVMVAAFFIAIMLLLDWLAQIILYSLIIVLFFLPFVLLYKAEKKDEKK